MVGRCKNFKAFSSRFWQFLFLPNGHQPLDAFFLNANLTRFFFKWKFICRDISNNLIEIVFDCFFLIFFVWWILSARLPCYVLDVAQVVGHSDSPLCFKFMTYFLRFDVYFLCSFSIQKHGSQFPWLSLRLASIIKSECRLFVRVNK